MPVEAPQRTSEERELEALIEEARARAKRRRLGYLALAISVVLVAGALYLALGGDGGRTLPPEAPSAGVPAPAKEVLSRDPYMGVSCRIPNSVACDRVGLSVWLRRPAASIDATIAGREFALDDSNWSGPARQGERRLFAGFLQPAGLIDGPLEVTPDASHDRWIGRQPVSVPVSLRILRDGGAVITTTVEVGLSPGYG